MEKQNGWVKKFVSVLLLMNLAGAAMCYIGWPMLLAMSHRDLLWMTLEIREAIFVFNMLAAVLLIGRYFYLGVAILAVTGTVTFVYALQMGNNVMLRFLFSYWDVIGLLALDALYRRKSQSGKLESMESD
jgi:hypothetical protein